jgi:type IV pilus assembly protein PilV
MRKESGFSLLEVLITMLVAMFGVLGMASMQMMAVNNTETARYQSIATVLANSMAARMQANSSYWAIPATNISVNNTAVTNVTASSVNCSQSVCTDKQMAYYDLQNWGASLNAALPSAVGIPLPAGGGNVASSATINCPLSTPMVCKITLYWSENNIALNNNAITGATGVLASGASTAHQYTTLVSILL